MPKSLPIILASQSPRRRELLARTGIPFRAIAPDASAEPEGEQPRTDESTADFVRRLAFQKAANVAQQLTDPAVVIGCDTVADVDGKILGKPSDRADAQRMLRLLSGRRHSVWSGLCLVNSATKQYWWGDAESVLEMKVLSHQELQLYLDSEQWREKSGAFGYQDGHQWLTLISGSVDNVVGLPVDLLQSLLQQADS
jgi:septum formation protein